MKYTTRKSAILLLSDGTIFHGKSIGITGKTFGEVCFNTGMTGYQEIFTDPSYFGQLMVATNAHIGNYGVNDNEVESGSIKIAGLVCKQFNEFHSRKRSSGSLKDYFLNNNIVAISDVEYRKAPSFPVKVYVNRPVGLIGEIVCQSFLRCRQVFTLHYRNMQHVQFFPIKISAPGLVIFIKN